MSKMDTNFNSPNSTTTVLQRQTKRIAPTAMAVSPNPATAELSGTSQLSSGSSLGSGLPAGHNNGQGPGPSDLTSLFECPVCFDYVLPPIYQVMR